MRKTRPLALVVAPDALADVRAARRWLQNLDERSAERFTHRLEVLLTQLCESLPGKIALTRPPQQDVNASLGLQRPVFQERFYSSAKKPVRRSNASTWRLFYALLDPNGDQQPEVLEVLRVFHAAAVLPWNRIEALELDQVEDDSPQETG